MFAPRSSVRASILAASVFAVAGSAAQASPPGTLTYESTWYGGYYTITGQGAGKTSASFEKSFGPPPQWSNFATRTVPPTSGRIWSIGPNDVPYSNWDVRINWGGGNITGSTRLAQLDNSDNPATVTVAAGTPSIVNNFEVSFYQNTASTQAAFGTQWLSAGSSFTLSLPAGFTWNGTPTVAALGGGLTLGSPLAAGNLLTIPILSNAHTDPSSGFQITSSTLAFSGIAPVGTPQVPMSFHFDNPNVSDYAGDGSGYCEMNLFQVVPAPATLAPFGLAGVCALRRRRR